MCWRSASGPAIRWWPKSRNCPPPDAATCAEHHAPLHGAARSTNSIVVDRALLGARCIRAVRSRVICTGLPCTGESKRSDVIKGAVVELGRVCFLCLVGPPGIDAIVMCLDVQYLYFRWNDPVRTGARFRPTPSREPGLCTDEMAVWSGDTVVRDEEGFLYFIGHKDELIKTSGYRVSPSKIEEVAHDTGLVGDAVALGLEDPNLGQQMVLVVTPISGAEVDVDALLFEMRKALPLYMLPKRVDIRPEVPRSLNGKFDRTLLREELTA
jgi:acyl-CoA synthetase (AMP-forming)/AMP-acid ligase II